MRQLHKKSFLAAATGHVCLLVILLIGPPFYWARHEPPSPSKPERAQGTLTVVPNELVEKTLENPAKPNAATTAKRPPTAPANRQQLAHPVEKAPQVDVSKPVLWHVAGNKSAIAENRTTEQTADREQQVNDVLEPIRKQFAPGPKTGPVNAGGGANVDYQQFVAAVYHNAGLAPGELADDDATVKVSVTVARNGAVVSSQILKRSGVSTLDLSIEAVLKRVRSIGRSFSDSEKAAQQNFVIDFNLKAKRRL